MHIGMVHLTGGRFPPDIRVEKEIDALRRAGMRVSVLCPRVAEDEPAIEGLAPGVTVHRCRTKKPGRIRQAWQNWTLIRPQCKPVIEKFLALTRADVLHVHDLHLVPTTLSVARRHATPVVADFHETMSAAVRAYRANRPWWLRMLISLAANGVAYRWHELRCARRCEKVIVVVEEGAEPFLRAGIAQQKLVVVANREDETTMRFPLPHVDERIAAEYANRWVAAYVGGTGAHRGIDTVVKGIQAILKDVPNFLLLVVGANDKARQEIRQLASNCGVSQSVSILGWQPFDRCLQYMLLSSACLVPFNDFEHTQMAAPHKLFQYMACARPVVVSNCRALKRIVETAGAGLVFKANDPNQFAKAVVRLAKDRTLCDRCAANGRRAALTELSWKHDAARLVAMYEAMGKKYGFEGSRGGNDFPRAALLEELKPNAIG